MKNRNYTTEDGFVNLHQTRGTKLRAYGDELKQKNFHKK